MASLADHLNSAAVKMLLMGDPGTGKTGALASLVIAGYRLRILDYDNGLDSLATYIKRGGGDLSLVQYESLRDKLKSSPLGPILDGIPTAFTRGLNLLDKWSDGTKPKDWGLDTILVIDTSTSLGDAAFNWAKAMNPSCKDPRQWYGAAQDAIESTISLLTSKDFNANVIINAHVNWIERPDGTMKGYPTTIGKALSMDVARFFNSVALVESSGQGNNVKRTVRTTPTALIDLKNPASFRMLPQLPIETGLADFFKTLKGDEPAKILTQASA